MTVLSRRAVILAIAATLPVAATAQAQPYPRRPIRTVLPFPAGSATDGATRLIAEDLRKSLGQPIVIENQAGANGIIAAQTVKRAAPDGYTLLVSTNSAHGVNPAIYNQLPYDPEADFDPVAGLITIPQLLCVRKDFPAEDLAGLIDLTRQRAATRPMTYGSGNTSSRVAAELLAASARLELLHVPYRGTPQALQDLVGGQIDLFFADPMAAMGFLTAGDLKALAVTASARLPALPQVPTMPEAGQPDVLILSWAAVFAPVGTDPAIVERLNQEINAVLARPEIVQHFHRTGAEPFKVTPAELRRFVSAELVRWARLAELARLPRM